MKKPTIREKLQYKFDSMMSSSRLSLIYFLLIASLIVAVIVGALLVVFNEYDAFFDSFVDAIASIINTEMPYSSDGGGLAYLVFISIAAVFGLLVTSILIGIFSSAIEEKANDLKRGNSLVLENGHTVVLGYTSGEYTLLNQLIIAAGKKPCCLVVADNIERDEMEQEIRDNLEYGKNIRIICRKANIFDPVSLEKCSIASARNVIISPMSDSNTIKALLAVSSIINSVNNDVRVGAIVSNDEFSFPETIAKKHNVVTLKMNDILSRIIAHSCTQEGISETFREIFNFEGSELYNITIPGTEGLAFSDIMCRVDQGVPIGICNGENIVLNPSPERILKKGESLIVFAEEKESAKLVELPQLLPFESLPDGQLSLEPESMTAIIGYNRTIGTIIRELPENVFDVIFVGLTDDQKDIIEYTASLRRDLSISFCNDNLNDEFNLKRLCEKVSHFALLSDYHMPEEAADMRTISMILHLRDIRERYNLNFNITAEMRRESNQRLIAMDDNTDFIVASNMSSLFLAQLSESPELLIAFEELLSNEGNEIYLKPAFVFGCSGEMSVAEIRQRTLKYGYIFIGYNRPCTVGFNNTYNPALNEVLSIDENVKFIVIGEE